MISRKAISATRRFALLRNKGGCCHICGGMIQVSEGWEVEHIIPFAMGGADDESNWAPAHTKCHKSKTAHDIPTIAKAKRIEMRHVGAKRSRNPIRGWKKFDGTAVKNPRA